MNVYTSHRQTDRQRVIGRVGEWTARLLGWAGKSAGPAADPLGPGCRRSPRAGPLLLRGQLCCVLTALPWPGEAHRTLRGGPYLQAPDCRADHTDGIPSQHPQDSAEGPLTKPRAPLSSDRPLLVASGPLPSPAHRGGAAGAQSAQGSLAPPRHEGAFQGSRTAEAARSPEVRPGPGPRPFRQVLSGTHVPGPVQTRQAGPTEDHRQVCSPGPPREGRAQTWGGEGPKFLAARARVLVRLQAGPRGLPHVPPPAVHGGLGGCRDRTGPCSEGKAQGLRTDFSDGSWPWTGRDRRWGLVNTSHNVPPEEALLCLGHPRPRAAGPQPTGVRDVCILPAPQRPAGRVCCV
ncbi:collagen alpha-1(I) chain-like [Phyllostomus hastatus]|uniref:collagen alpha-1(I) chain-like n=1 Tax=Phyllostomus hastatus TaxID=9423 RepID=UPI001E680DC3|nr:collagen alpha-1(I) chain-like [Phyllostomus hastatus]